MNGPQIIGALAFFGALAFAIWKVASGASSQITASIPGVTTALDTQAAPIDPDIDTLARTIYGEARGESEEGRMAVAAVVMNRVAIGSGYGWPSSPAAVCRQKNQFSCWNAGDPNLPVIESVTAADPVFQDCIDIAQAAVQGILGDNTFGATFYHANYIPTPSTWVSAGLIETVQIDHQIFFRLPGVA